MPIRYAIKHEIEDAADDTPSWRSSINERTYPFVLKGRPEWDLREVPREVAKNSGDFAAYKQLVTVDGKPLTDWVSLSSSYRADISEIVKKSQFPEQPDFMGTMLKSGDYVLAHIKGRAELQACKVVGFVKQGKVRILPFAKFTYGDATLLRFATELVKIPDTLLGDNPEEDWQGDFHISNDLLLD